MRPIFIGGCDRSGTTLLGSLLGRHPECVTVPESHFKTDHLMQIDPKDETYDLVQRIKEDARFRLWSINLDVTAIAELADLSYSALIERFACLFGENHGKPACELWVDHTPNNIRYATNLLELFPKSKMIHIVRDGRAVAASIMPLIWGPNVMTTAARWWFENVAQGLAAESYWSSRIQRVHYEDLIQAPNETLKLLCEFAGIEFHINMVEKVDLDIPCYAVGQHDLVGQRPDASRINAWEQKLSPRQIEIFEGMTGEFLGNLGYELKYGLRARVPSWTERRLSDLRQECKRVINRFRMRRKVESIE